MKTAHVLAGGEKDIAVYLVANENALGFYEKLGIKSNGRHAVQQNRVDGLCGRITNG